MNKELLNYAKTSIENKQWQVGRSIDSLKKISIDCNISKYKTRKFIQELIDLSIIDKYHNKFYLISTDTNNTIASIQQRLIYKAKLNLMLLQLKDLGYIYDKKTLSYIEKNNSKITLYFPLRKNKLTFDIIDLNEQFDEYINIVNRHLNKG